MFLLTAVTVVYIIFFQNIIVPSFCFIPAGKHYCKTVDWMDSTGREMTLWQLMLNRPNFWVEGLLVMRSTLEGGGRYNA